MKPINFKSMLLIAAAIFALSAAAYAHGDEESHADEQGAEEHGTDTHDHADEHDGDDGHGEHDAEQGENEEHEHEEGLVKLDAEQISAAGIATIKVGAGQLAREVTVPGKIVGAADRMAQIVPKVSGTVSQAAKNIGDKVEKGETLALIESREMADSVAEYMAASRAAELARSNYNREKGLWEKKVTAEQDYLTAKNAYEEASIRLDLARQKQQALGLEGTQDTQQASRFYALKAPISGRIINRELTLGEYVDTTHTAFTIADLSVVWLEAAIPPNSLDQIREGQLVRVRNNGQEADGKLIFVSPAIDPETSSAKAIIEIDNALGTWRPGAFANAAIATSADNAGIIVPNEALQTVEGAQVVFVRTPEGFTKRGVTTGRTDSRGVEVTAGLTAGEEIATANSFVLKAELGKSEAAHEH